MKTQRFIEKEPAIRRNGLCPIEKMIERGEVRTVRVASACRLFELAGIA